jgi:hypothetical protein
MKQLISHIEFLLHTHNCVIVPSLGGFVVNTTPARRDGISAFTPPESELVFNRELSHNDGLLVESYMRTDNISFENATKKINDAVRQIMNQLRTERFVDLGDLGSFRMVDDLRFVYQSNPFVRPEYFGLSRASLQPIIQLQTADRRNSEDGSRKSVVRKTGIVAAVAAVVTVIMLLFPVQDSPLRHQTAQLIAISSPSLHLTKEVKASKEVTTSNKSEEVGRESVAVAAQQEERRLDERISVPEGPRFYIVTGVYEVPEIADNMINLLKSEGYSDASFFKRPNRTTVYAASFSTREEADQHLKQLKQNFPNHQDAWILKK